jgi:ABC-type branched-subunit amino acid transport system substrate-binding protein
MRRSLFVSLWAIGMALTNEAAWTADWHGPGVTDNEIRIGNTAPYSGPASSYGTFGRSEAAYFAMINDGGGINGRKVNFISRDDAYSPPKTFEQVRKLIEEDQVLLMFGTIGTPPNTAIQDYLNDNKVPQLFITAGAEKWNDPKHHPWTMGWLPTYQTEGRIYGRYILTNFPDAKIAVLYQNDDFGKDYLTGLVKGLGAKADQMIVATKSYETTDPTVDSQIAALQSSGATVLMAAVIPKIAAQAIRKVYDVGWKPTFFLSATANSVGAVMRLAGPEKGVGIISASYYKDPTDEQWQDTSEYKDWLAWMKKYNRSSNVTDAFAVISYCLAQTMVTVLKASDGNLSRENVMNQAANLHDLALPMLLPGITISTSREDFAPIKRMQLMKFDGATWRLFGEVMSGD